jgi:NAD-dependent deacetylase sirtuin 4
MRYRDVVSGIQALVELFARGPVCVLTGAGLSTASGIPDYRGPGTAARARNPIQYRDFVRHEAARRRYWARSMVGFPRVASAAPNPGHHVLARLEQRGLLSGLITQNVDGLHGAAGSARVVELHGRLHEVVCLQCGAISSRQALQAELESHNPGFDVAGAAQAPDGDADLERDLEHFVVIDCGACRGPLKPNVVFFGENVPSARVAEAFAQLESARSLLVLGSSLTVFSGFRFVRRATELVLPVAIVNLGETRGDSLASLKLEAHTSDALMGLEAALS